MCIEDIRLGRQSKCSETRVIVGTTATILCGEDTDRVSLIVSIPISGNFFMSTLHDLVINEGLRLVSTALATIELDIRKHGAIVTKAWYGIHSVGGASVTVLEARLPVQ